MINLQKKGFKILSKETEGTKMQFVNPSFSVIENIFSIIYVWKVHLIS